MCRETDEIDAALLEINKELEDEIEASKVLFIIRKTIKASLDEQLSSFSILLDDVRKVVTHSKAKQYFAFDEVRITE